MKMIALPNGKWLNPRQIVTIDFREEDSAWNAYATIPNDDEFLIAGGFETQEAAKTAIEGGLDIQIIDDF